jgi:hypothetical protein
MDARYVTLSYAESNGDRQLIPAGISQRMGRSFAFGFSFCTTRSKRGVSTLYSDRPRRLQMPCDELERAVRRDVE